jgi:hypothetical protein
MLYFSGNSRIFVFASLLPLSRPHPCARPRFLSPFFTISASVPRATQGQTAILSHPPSRKMDSRGAGKAVVAAGADCRQFP